MNSAKTFALLFTALAALVPLRSQASDSRFARLIHQASFSPDWSRYPSPDTVLAGLRENFPHAQVQTSSNDCFMLTSANRPLLGDSEPATGRASIDEPNSSFANWYANCLALYVKSEAQAAFQGYVMVPQPDGSSQGQYVPITLTSFRDFYGDAVISDCLANDDPGGNFVRSPNVSSFSCRWSKVSDAAKKARLVALITRYIGPEDVVVDLGIAKDENELIGRILNEVNRFARQPDHRFDFLGEAAGELPVARADMMMKFLLNLEETLKY